MRSKKKEEQKKSGILTVCRRYILLLLVSRYIAQRPIWHNLASGSRNENSGSEGGGSPTSTPGVDKNERCNPFSICWFYVCPGIGTHLLKKPTNLPTSGYIQEQGRMVTPVALQSRFLGCTPLEFQVLCPKNRTAVLKGFKASPSTDACRIMSEN